MTIRNFVHVTIFIFYIIHKIYGDVNSSILFYGIMLRQLDFHNKIKLLQR